MQKVNSCTKYWVIKDKIGNLFYQLCIVHTYRIWVPTHVDETSTSEAIFWQIYLPPIKVSARCALSNSPNFWQRIIDKNGKKGKKWGPSDLSTLLYYISQVIWVSKYSTGWWPHIRWGRLEMKLPRPNYIKLDRIFCKKNGQKRSFVASAASFLIYPSL